MSSASARYQSHQAVLRLGRGTSVRFGSACARPCKALHPVSKYQLLHYKGSAGFRVSSLSRPRWSKKGLVNKRDWLQAVRTSHLWSPTSKSPPVHQPVYKFLQNDQVQGPRAFIPPSKRCKEFSGSKGTALQATPLSQEEQPAATTDRRTPRKAAQIKSRTRPSNPDQLKIDSESTSAASSQALLEKGKRLINTTPRESRWRLARTEQGPSIPEGNAESLSQAPLDGYFDPFQLSRFRRKPQSEGQSRHPPNGIRKPRSNALIKESSSGLLTGYESASDSRVPSASTAAALTDWIVETCPVCHGTATVPCEGCDLAWSEGTCLECQGMGYKTCSHCNGTGTTYAPAARLQKAKISSPTLPTQRTRVVDDVTEEGPSLLEASRIMKRRVRPRDTGSDIARVGENGKGVPKSAEHRLRIGLALKGRPRSPLSPSLRQKLSDKRKQFFERPGTRERWSQEAKTRKAVHCTFCGRQGHSRRFCPDLGYVKIADRPCPTCGEVGHAGKKLCPNRSNAGIAFRCKKCGAYGHDEKSCPNSSALPGRKLCEICGQPGHRVRECPKRPEELIIQRCSICGQPGHNKRKCPYGANSEEAFGA